MSKSKPDPGDDPQVVATDDDLVADAIDELHHRAVLDGDLYAQYELARLEEEEREAEYARAYWAEEDARRERELSTYWNVVCMRRHLPSFKYLRPLGRERRVACNARTRGSRRVRTGPSSDDDPHEDDPDHDRDLVPTLLGRAGSAPSSVGWSPGTTGVS